MDSSKITIIAAAAFWGALAFGAGWALRGGPETATTSHAQMRSDTLISLNAALHHEIWDLSVELAKARAEIARLKKGAGDN